MINSHKIYSLTNDLIDIDRKDGKYRFVLPTNIDCLLYHMNKFCFATTSFTKETSYLNL